VNRVIEILRLDAIDLLMMEERLVVTGFCGRSSSEVSVWTRMELTFECENE
jgi:hypothetical protein